MEVERFDGTKYRREFKTLDAMVVAAVGAAYDPGTKKITLHMPKMRIPKKKAKK
jgi:hypothetical protein